MTVHVGGRGPGHLARIVGAGSVTPLLVTPTVTNVSALGATPLVLSLSDGNYVAGKYLQWEFAGSLTPAKNTDGSYTTTTQKGVTFIDGDSWARLDLALGYSTPSGAFAFHCRVLQDDPAGPVTVTDQLGNTFNADNSGWSTDYTDTINVSVNVWNGTTGTNKSQYVAISGSPALTVTGTGGVGANEGVRGTTSTTGKRHFEVKVTTLGGGSPDNISVGIDDGTTALGPALFGLPNPGVIYQNGNIVKNGSTVQTGLASVVANDVVTCEFDTVGGTVSFYKNGTQLGTTVTGISFSNYYSYCACEQADVLTGNFGQNAWTMTPTSGYTGW